MIRTLQYSYALNILMHREICKACLTATRDSVLASRWLGPGCNISEMCLEARPCAAAILNSSRRCICVSRLLRVTVVFFESHLRSKTSHRLSTGCRNLYIFPWKRQKHSRLSGDIFRNMKIHGGMGCWSQKRATVPCSSCA